MFDANQKTWISGRAARVILGGSSYSTLARLAMIGAVRTRIERGAAPLYRREDVEAYAASQTERELTPA